MVKIKFMDENFLLHTKTAQTLFHEYAKNMSIFDYHCHLPVQDIAENKQFKNLSEVWLGGDHYKWRAMRSNGIEERFCTGDADDYEKFKAWAKTVPFLVRNQLYHWTLLELNRYFGINELLNPSAACGIYEKCSGMLHKEEFRARGLMQMMNVKAICTTDDPTDSLMYHKQIKNDSSFNIKVLPTFRPDKAMAVEKVEKFNEWVNTLEKASEISINDYMDFLDAIRKRHDFFHQMGCRISDHGIETAYAEDYTKSGIKTIFNKVRSRKELSLEEVLKFKSAMMVEFGIMDYEKNWAQQLHLGAMRNNNTLMFRKLGADIGFDSVGDIEIAVPLSRFLDRLHLMGKLPKTILYNLNPRDNEVLATMAGNFQDSSIPSKIQFGSAWWFLDRKDGIEKQINALSCTGLLSRFIGMLTDSRSFLSYPRHEYFRRILCNIIAQDVENGELPNDVKFLGHIIKDISFNNAVKYVGIEIEK